MFTQPDDLPDARIVTSLGDGWGIAATDIEYAPVGFGSHHWFVWANEARWFVTVDDLLAKRRRPDEELDESRRRLASALSTAWILHRAGLSFVVAPRQTARGQMLHVVDERFAVAVYPHIDGDSYAWGDYPTRPDTAPAPMPWRSTDCDGTSLRLPFRSVSSGGRIARPTTRSRPGLG